MAKKKSRLVEYKKMLKEGCPECGSTDTYKTKATINMKDDVDVCICDECGHTVEKPSPYWRDKNPGRKPRNIYRTYGSKGEGIGGPRKKVLKLLRILKKRLRDKNPRRKAANPPMTFVKIALVGAGAYLLCKYVLFKNS